MILSVTVAILTCGGLILTVLLKPQLKIAGHPVSLYAYIPLVGALILLACGMVSIESVIEKFTADEPSNPIRIIILFISMGLMSVMLEETGFFEFIAEKIAEKAGDSQIKIFVLFYLTVSVLTIFTSNDVVILTFTPFICQFCKKVGVDPVPYIVAEFVAANTWSILLLIGNPTNIFLTQSYGADFMEYLSVMWLPALFCGVSSFLTLFVIFYKKLKKPVNRSVIDIKIKDKPVALISGIIIAVCTILIAISSYIGFEMWIIAFSAALTLYLAVLIIKLATRNKPTIILSSLKMAPWQMIPLVTGMFVVVMSLVGTGVTQSLCSFIGTDGVIIKYGFLSAIVSNITNNIPMSVLFSSIAVEISDPLIYQKAVYSTVIGSNVGAFLSPLGALAGLMFTSIISRYGIKFGFLDFVKYGALVGFISLSCGIVGLYLVL